jgi:ubiquinone/menaquinone biosynthesis C-methylase UbiE
MRKGAGTVVGGDVSRGATGYAKMHYKRKHLGFIRLDGANLPFLANTFDVIVSFETIEHLKEYRKFLFECAWVLKDGGLFICSTPNKEISSPHTVKPLNPFHVHEFYIKEFHNLLKKYFIHVTLYGQCWKHLFLILKNKFEEKLLMFGSKILSNVSGGDKIRDFYAYITRTLPQIVKSEEEVLDEILDENYKILPFKSNFFNTPAFIIAVAKKELYSN